MDTDIAHCAAKLLALGHDLKIVIAVTQPALAVLCFKQHRQSLAYHAAQKLVPRFGNDRLRLL